MSNLSFVRLGTVCRRVGSQPWLLAVIASFVAGFALAAPDPAFAQEELSITLRKNGTALKNAFRTVTEPAARVTCRILSDDKLAALGLIVGEDGWILTKASECQGELQVRLPDGDVLDAVLFGIHVPTDLGLLKVDSSGLTAAKLTERPVRPGQWVASVGMDVRPVCVGVIGGETARVRRDRGILGVHLEDGSLGALVTKVYPGSGAELAGLLPNDEIRKVRGLSVKERRDVQARLSSTQPGEYIELVVARDGVEHNVRVTATAPTPEFFGEETMSAVFTHELSTRRGGFDKVFPHDGIVRPHDCGGPVVTADGTIVGLNIARAGRVTTLVLPTSEITGIVDELKSGRFTPPVASVLPRPQETQATGKNPVEDPQPAGM